MGPTDADEMVSSADADQTAPLGKLVDVDC